MTGPRKTAPRVLLLSVNMENDPYPVYPLGLEYLRAPLERDGCETLLVDCRVAAAQQSDIRVAVRDFRPDVILVSIRNADNNDSNNTICYLPEAYAVIRAVREASAALIVLGGSGYSLFPEEILSKSDANYGVVGPAEHVIVPLVRALVAGSARPDIPGLVSRAGGSCTRTAGTSPQELEPATLRSEELVSFYWAKGGALNVQLKRGCPFSCIYCTYPLLEGHGIVEKKPSAAVDEMQAMYEKHGVDRFFVVDSVFNLVPETARAFAREIVRRRLPVHWTAYFAPSGLTPDDMRLWKESGLDGVEFGVDSLCPELLVRWGKPFTVGDVMASAAACEAAGVPYSMYLILGGPGETQDTMEETVSKAMECRKAVVFGFVGMRIYPGTPLFELARREGVVTDAESLLEPKFYVSALLDKDYLARRCEELGNLRNWLVVGRSLQAKNKAAAMMRRRNWKGAMWQLLSPQ